MRTSNDTRQRNCVVDCASYLVHKYFSNVSRQWQRSWNTHPNELLPLACQLEVAFLWQPLATANHIKKKHENPRSIINNSGIGKYWNIASASCYISSSFVSKCHYLLLLFMDIYGASFAPIQPLAPNNALHLKICFVSACSKGLSGQIIKVSAA